MSETNAHTKLDDFIPRSHTSEELAARRDMITLIHRSYKMGAVYRHARHLFRPLV